MTVNETRDSLRTIWEETNYDIDIDCTCNKCYPNGEMVCKCNCAFDLYNINGDCLAIK